MLKLWIMLLDKVGRILKLQDQIMQKRVFTKQPEEVKPFVEKKIV